MKYEEKSILKIFEKNENKYELYNKLNFKYDKNILIIEKYI